MVSRYRNPSHSLNNNNDADDVAMTDAPAEQSRQQQQEAEEEEDLEWLATGGFKPEHNPYGGMADTTAFTILFPSYRELYLKQIWPLVESLLSAQPLLLQVKLNAKEGHMAVQTTQRTYDPCAILTGRDILLLLARGMNLEHARRLLEPDVTYDLIKIKSYVGKYDTFMNRRQRLLGPNGATLKALQLLTGTNILIQGKTVSVLGSLSGCKEVRRVIEDCMENIHPIYHIKRLMVKRELEKNPTLKNEDWSKYMPQFKKSVGASAKKRHKKTSAAAAAERKKKYSPFPNPNHFTKSKMDLAIESGEFFMSEAEKQQKRKEEKADQVRAKKTERLERKAQLNVPLEDRDPSAFAAKKTRVPQAGGAAPSAGVKDLAAKLKQKILQQDASKKRKERESSSQATDFISQHKDGNMSKAKKQKFA